MKKLLQPWKIIIVLTFLMIFSSLFAFIYTEQVKLPSDNWSNSIELDTYNPKMDFKSLASNNTLALGIDDNRFTNIVAMDNNLLFKTFNIDGQILNEGSIAFEHNVTQVSGSMHNERMELITLSEGNEIVTFITVNPETFAEMDRKIVTLEGMKLKLSDNHVTAFNNDSISILIDGEITTYEPGFDGRIELAEANRIGSKTVISAITMKVSTFHMNVFTEENNKTQSEQLYVLPSLSAIKPVNVTMALNDDEAIIISTMKHSRFGTNYVDFFSFNPIDASAFEHSGYEMDTYQAIPYLIKEENGSLSYLINFWASNLGRTEIAKGVQAYPNLYKTTHGTDDMKQLTKSERSSVKPSYLKLGQYEYLVHNEQNDLENKVYISSNNPELIARSRDYTQSTLFDIFMRTLTTYPALILAGIPPMMTVILPLLVLVVPVLMFKLNWAEQNKGKMTLIIIFVFIVSKIFAFGIDIFPFFTEQGSWPPFLEASTSHWTAFALLSLLTLFVYRNRLKYHEGANEHFLKSIFVYVFLDIVIMIMFFMPYSII